MFYSWFCTEKFLQLVLALRSVYSWFCTEKFFLQLGLQKVHTSSQLVPNSWSVHHRWFLSISPTELVRPDYFPSWFLAADIHTQFVDPRWIEYISRASCTLQLVPSTICHTSPEEDPKRPFSFLHFTSRTFSIRHFTPRGPLLQSLHCIPKVSPLHFNGSA